MNSKFGECCNCPALVDGRFFTEYRDRDALQFNLMKDNNLTNSNAFRNYLIANGTSLMSNNTKDLQKKQDLYDAMIVTSSIVSGGNFGFSF